MTRTYLLLVLWVPFSLLTAAARAADPATTLWFDQPARSFHASLPLGNGRLGAMVFGGLPEEHLQLTREFEHLLPEADEFSHFDQLIDSGIIQRVREGERSRIREEFARRGSRQGSRWER